MNRQPRFLRWSITVLLISTVVVAVRLLVLSRAPQTVLVIAWNTALALLIGYVCLLVGYVPTDPGTRFVIGVALLWLVIVALSRSGIAPPKFRLNRLSTATRSKSRRADGTRRRPPSIERTRFRRK